MRLRISSGRRRLYLTAKITVATGTALLIFSTVFFRARDTFGGALPDSTFGTALGIAEVALGAGLLASLVLVPVAAFAKELIGRPCSWDQVGVVLNQLARSAFSNECNQDPSHHHRVTLFKYVTWGALFCRQAWREVDGKKRTPWSGWLKPIARSGHATQNTDCLFLASDRGSVEGMAGHTWISESILTWDGLPALDSRSGPEMIEAYCNRSEVDPAYVKTRLSDSKNASGLPVALMGIPIMQNQKPIAVVVIDSRRANGIRRRHGKFAAGIEMSQNVLASALRCI